MSALAIVLRVIVLILSLFSFVPHFYPLWSRRDSPGISLYYVLFNSITFTEHFALGLHFIANNTGFEDSIVESPPTAENWLDLFQFFVVWYCYLVLFTLCLYYPPHHRGLKCTVLAIHFLFMLISLIPVVVEANLPLGGSDRQWLATLITTLHRSFITPLVTILNCASLFPQAAKIFSRSSPGALSKRGLATQAIVFTLVALYWPFRIQMSPDLWQEWSWRSLIIWYQIVGWAAVDNAVFAVIQAILFWISRRQYSSVKEVATDGETEPLL